jgi:uncharacterized OB-fold protein
MPGYFSELEDSAAKRFYRELEGERLSTTRCGACDFTFFPPRIVCPLCLGADLEWVELSGKGTVYAFTQQHYAIVHTKPEVVGAVELEGCSGRVFALIGALLEDVEIGMPVVATYVKSPFGMTILKFVPQTGSGLES